MGGDYYMGNKIKSSFSIVLGLVVLFFLATNPTLAQEKVIFYKENLYVPSWNILKIRVGTVKAGETIVVHWESDTTCTNFYILSEGDLKRVKEHELIPVPVVNRACGHGRDGTITYTPDHTDYFEVWTFGTVWNAIKFYKLEVKVIQSKKPSVEYFNVQPRSIILGQSVKIFFSVKSDIGLKRVELWRKCDDGEWKEVKRIAISGKHYSGSFTDKPPSTGTYWYGIHVVDNLDRWSCEKEPIKVVVRSLSPTTVVTPVPTTVPTTTVPIITTTQIVPQVCAECLSLDYRIDSWVQPENPSEGYKYKDVLHIKIINNDDLHKILFRINYKVKDKYNNILKSDSILVSVKPHEIRELEYPFSYNVPPKYFDWEIYPVSYDGKPVNVNITSLSKLKYNVHGWIESGNPTSGYKYNKILYIKIKNSDEKTIIFRIDCRIRDDKGSLVYDSFLVDVEPNEEYVYEHPFYYNIPPIYFEWNVVPVSYLPQSTLTASLTTDIPHQYQSSRNLTFTISIPEPTPGFELSLTILSFITILIWRLRKKSL